MVNKFNVSKVNNRFEIGIVRLLNNYPFFFFLIGIHSMQGVKHAKHRVTRKRITNRLKDTGNLLRKNPQSIGVC